MPSRSRRHQKSPTVPRRSKTIKRIIPTDDLLSETQLVTIEQHADCLGAEIGIEFRDGSMDHFYDPFNPGFYRQLPLN